MVRGVLTTPEAIVAPSRGKWWNDNEGKWITTNLLEERKWLLVQPEFNEDILGDHVVIVSDDDDNELATKQVADMYYYDIMEVPPDATEDVIERMYHKLAKRFSPGRAGAGEAAQQQMDEITTAYMILTNPEFRHGYDEYGMDFVDNGGLSGHFSTPSAGEAPPLVDPYELYAVLFGSEQLQDWIGILGAATAAKASQTLTMVQARTIQVRRVTKLALLLAKRLQEYCDADEDDTKKEAAQEKWRIEAERLVQTSYGNELVNTIGKVYSLCAVQFLGSLENGCGALPSMSAWAKRQYTNISKGLRDVASDVTHPTGDWNQLKVQHAVEQVSLEETELQQAQTKLQQEGILKTYLRYLWTRTVLDITDTLHETTQMVLFDQAVSPEVRSQRAHGLQRLGHVLEQVSQKHMQSQQLESLGMVNSKRNPMKQEDIPNSSASTRALYEEVAFAAMLETCVRKEQEYKRAHTTQQTTDDL